MSDAVTMSNEIFKKAIQAYASDIHFYSDDQHANIYFRIFGQRHHIKTITLSEYNLLLAYYKFSSGMDIGEIRKPQNGTMLHYEAKMKFALRLSTLPLNITESLAIRILPQESKHKLHQLFLFPEQLTTLQAWLNNQAGLILFTGATGSGKTTALYALLEELLTERRSQIITLEDPVEKTINGILQVQINERANITYQTGLKATLRHDPDIIMVGEIRDKETAHFAFEAALTGHLVISTLHAKNAQGTIHRLLDMGIKPIEIEQTLLGVAAFELLPLTKNNKVVKRAAIMELIADDDIECALKGNDKSNYSYQTFHDLRKQAYEYGYISKQVYEKR